MNDLYEKIKIIHFPSVAEPFVILNKPRGLPSAPLFEGDESALTFALEKFPQIKNVKGKKNIEYGLVHRIDTETKGLLLIAQSQAFYDSIIEEQTNGRFIKTYSAVCDFSFNEQEPAKKMPDGFPPLDYSVEKSLRCIENLTNESSLVINVSSRFRPFGQKNREVRPVNALAGKAAEKKACSKKYSTQIVLSKKSDGIHAECKIKEGYRHQVRCHLAWLGFPVKNDPVYNPLKSSDSIYSGSSDSSDSKTEFMFTATGLDFMGFHFSA